MILPGLDALFSITFSSTGTMLARRFIAHICAVANVMEAIYGHEHWCQGHRKQGCY